MAQGFFVINVTDFSSAMYIKHTNLYLGVG